MSEKKNIESIKLIKESSQLALSHNLSSFDTNNTKAGLFISISAFSVPLFLGIFSNIPICKIWIFYLFVPIFINISGLFFFILALKTKKVQNGMSHLKYDEKINESEKSILLFEIGCNRDSLVKNEVLLESQEKNLKTGLILTLIGIISFSVLYLIYLTT